jgi:hypothetical protein
MRGDDAALAQGQTELPVIVTLVAIHLAFLQLGCALISLRFLG